VRVEFLDTPFSAYMRLARYRIGARVAPVLSGPGHDVALVAALTLDPAGRPVVILKGGDTRPARVLRGEAAVEAAALVVDPMI
jgi:hypothetical protein